MLRIPRGGAADPAPECAEDSWPAILELAEAHAVTPLLDRAVQARAVRVPKAIRARLAGDRRTTALANLRHYGEFQRIARALHERAIAMIPLKGLHLAELVYRDISLRPMVDLDVLVPRRQVAEAVAVLRGLEYGHDADLASAVEAMLAIKCNVGMAHARLEIWLEVHWSLEEPPARCEEVVDQIWRTAAPGHVGDAQTLVMPPALLLLHVCAHLACNHGFAFSLRALCDIAEIIERYPMLDWPVVVDGAGRAGWERGVPAALSLAARHLGAAVPDDVLSAIGARTLDAALLDEAMEHLVACVEMPPALQTSPNLVAAASSTAPLSGLCALWRRTFIPRGELALLYGVAENSPRLGLFYAVRLRDLVRRYASAGWRLMYADTAVKLAAARHARLARWLNDKPTRAGGQEGSGGSAS